MHDDLEKTEQCFLPALWRQRRSFIVEVLRRFKAQSILDYGCGEASVLSFLILSSDEDKVKKMAGIDICENVLAEAIEACEPWASDYQHKKMCPLEIDIYKGSVSVPDDRLKKYEAIVCSEVIEHLFKKDLDPFLDVVLGFYKPRILIVTTPNFEYNVHFPALHYGTEHFIFRHDDHKFEWTRQQFQDWCSQGAEKHNYKVEFHGIGLLSDKQDDLNNGHCTQGCVFIRQDECTESTASVGEPHEMMKHIEFPYYNEPPKSEKEILQEIHSFIEALCKAEYYACSKVRKPSKLTEDTFVLEDIIDWNTFDIKEKEYMFVSQEVTTLDTSDLKLTETPLEIPILHIWDISRIRQLCKTLESFKNILIANQDPLIYTVHEDKLVVYKAFKIV